ncbi:MAG: YkgJ family cysteine cluster protein [Deltaproteobacteria bacterium]|nr:YkgJ family cysteine cluster protein [Deltaproteobacteria bacterium]MBW1953375.1 YkgJ family cysteine cluster protein [Deltaproteobacteria bacterium]MBW1987773.1 YkgJ family cysteine cluster protein [Deltaproteobacteria bacterium]MBW2134570.1 YkgJ family cysteine cluster protein [Deltaproteobacteria bacterium]
MEKTRKFTGKIRDNPITALERGSCEVMASLWKEYFTELLGMEPKSGRFRELEARIKQEANFQRLYREWNDLRVPERSFRWYQLLEITKKHKRNTEGLCVRCGECCQRHTPTLMSSDLYLFQNNVLTWTDVYTLRKGERVSSPRSGEVFALPEERLKIRHLPGTRQCQFYREEPNRCLIYDQRPQQCRDQACWLKEEEQPARSETPLSRQQLFGDLPELWELIEAHEQRCAYDLFETAVRELPQGGEEVHKTLFDLLHFDHYLRQMLIDDWEVPAAATELLLGRSLSQLLGQLGIKASMTPNGIFQLELAT